jgi:hypothetical protein
MTDLQFLFSNQLIFELEKLIKNSKNKLILISPYIDLDERIKDALKAKLNNPDFELKVLFGKNKDNFSNSIKKDSFDFLKKFTNIEIRYNERLHAKFYQNDFNFILTSMNLYNFSLSKNIEVGIMAKYKAKSLLEKFKKNTDGLLIQGLEIISEEVFGNEKETNPIEEFEIIFKDSDLKYKTIPNLIKKGEFIIKIDKLEQSYQKSNTKKTNVLSSKKTLSTTKLAEQLCVPSIEITKLMQNKGLVINKEITELGLSKGLVMKKNHLGIDFISYPENLPEFNVLKSKH